MEDYERTITSQQLASTVLRSCFRFVGTEIFLNFNKIPCIYETLHLISITPEAGIPYRHISPEEIRFLYLAYTEVAENTYSTFVDNNGRMRATPSNREIPQWIFDIVAEITSLTSRE
ncbi:MAG: hypothetical protein IPM69_00220 [Ignavibacteria bacterium]|nr:hypothetical protein [Ignavibacteria bacterium]